MRFLAILYLQLDFRSGTGLTSLVYLRDPEMMLSCLRMVVVEDLVKEFWPASAEFLDILLKCNATAQGL